MNLIEIKFKLKPNRSLAKSHLRAMHYLFKTSAAKHKYKCTCIIWCIISLWRFEYVKTKHHRQQVEDLTLRVASMLMLRQWDGRLCVIVCTFIFYILYVVRWGGGEADRKNNYLHSNYINSVRASLVQTALDSMFHNCSRCITCLIRKVFGQFCIWGNSTLKVCSFKPLRTFYGRRIK